MIRDPERRREVQEAWRRSRSPAYYRWLYARRKLRFDKAETFERMMREAAGHGLHASAAREALAVFDEREREIGNEFDHQLDQGVWAGTKGGNE